MTQQELIDYNRRCARLVGGLGLAPSINYIDDDKKFFKKDLVN
jgi:hypothetical protein